MTERSAGSNPAPSAIFPRGHSKGLMLARIERAMKSFRRNADQDWTGKRVVVRARTGFITASSPLMMTVGTGKQKVEVDREVVEPVEKPGFVGTVVDDPGARQRNNSRKRLLTVKLDNGSECKVSAQNVRLS